MKAEKHERRHDVAGSIPRVLFGAYIEGNEQFALIPTAIDALVSASAVEEISEGRLTWRQVTTSRMDEPQRLRTEELMTRLHMAYGIPLVGESRSAHMKHHSRKMLEHFVEHLGRPKKTSAYAINSDETHMIVDPRSLKRTWPGIVGEGVRAAIVYAQATGMHHPTLDGVNIHKLRRTQFLGKPIAEGLDSIFTAYKDAPELAALIRLYKRAAEWGYSSEGAKLARHHRDHHNLRKPHGITPFEVTDHLRDFNAGMASYVYQEVATLKNEGVLGPKVNLQSFVGELVKHGRLT